VWLDILGLERDNHTSRLQAGARPQSLIPPISHATEAARTTEPLLGLLLGHRLFLISKLAYP
jgi:hypothetical protein